MDTNRNYPHRNLTRLYCSSITYRCATGTLHRTNDGVSSHASASSSSSALPCVPCAYKICNFEIALDSEFTKCVPNQRPEQCPRSSSSRVSESSIDHGAEDGTMGYQRGMNVLTVGDGDFSFSLAVARLALEFGENTGVTSNVNNNASPKSSGGGMVVATSYESSETLRKVYPDFDQTQGSLKNLCGESESTRNRVVIGYNVDATKLYETLPHQVREKKEKFHRICWNFPCSAMSAGQDGQNSAMEHNKALVRDFVANALQYLDEKCGEIHMAHKTKPPYNQWGLEKVALDGIENGCNVEQQSGCGGKQVNQVLEFKGRIVFDKCNYAGYTPRKALDRKSFPCHDACIYVFGWKTRSENVDFDGDCPFAGRNPSLICHSTLASDLELSKDEEPPTPLSVIPVTENMIDKIRSIHLQEKQNLKRNSFGSSSKRNGTRNSKRRKKR